MPSPNLSKVLKTLFSKKQNFLTRGVEYLEGANLTYEDCLQCNQIQ